MRHKNVCLNCRRVDNLGTDFENFRTGECPECNNKMVFVSHKFRPPKITDKKAWKVAEYLISRGFIYQHITDEGGTYVRYPDNMKEAKEFVKKYHNQSIRKKRVQ